MSEDTQFDRRLLELIQTRVPLARLLYDQLAAGTGLSDYAGLWADKEYKKQRIALFSNQEAKWEAAHESA